MAETTSTNPRAQAFLDALVAGHAREAEWLVRAALDEGLRPEEVHVAVIAPAMRAVGELWARDELSVADEHLATAITYRVLGVLGDASRPSATPHGPRVLLAAPGAEQHVVGLRMVADTLEAAGYEVYDLGPQVPVEALARAVARWSPRLVGLSVTMPVAPGVTEAIARLREVDPELPVLLGGAGAPRTGLGGDRIALCDDVSRCVALAGELLSAA